MAAAESYRVARQTSADAYSGLFVMVFPPMIGIIYIRQVNKSTILDINEEER